MLSIAALLEIHSGDSAAPIKQSNHTINLNEKCPMTPAVLTPHNLQIALSSSKMRALVSLRNSSGWVCTACRCNPAMNMCSSIVACPENECLKVTERIFLTCARSECVDIARSLRNKDSKHVTGTGTVFRLAFRCANELMVDSRDAHSKSNNESSEFGESKEADDRESFIPSVEPNSKVPTTESMRHFSGT